MSAEGEGEGARSRPAKGPSAFRTIGEVAEDLDLPAHVLRFWESKFPQLKPLKRGGGRRYYRPDDVALLRRIRQCLYQDGYTIRGVQRLLGDLEERPAAGAEREAPPSLFPLEPAAGPRPVPSEPANAARRRPASARPRAMSPAAREALEEIRRDLREARALLDSVLRRGKPS